MRGRVLVLGANGFIGSHVAAALSSAGWSVRAGTRRIAEPARRAPTFDWVVADFAKLTTPQAWAPLLVGVEAVVNCVGVLQNGAGDSTRRPCRRPACPDRGVRGGGRAATGAYLRCRGGR